MLGRGDLGGGDVSGGAATAPDRPAPAVRRPHLGRELVIGLATFAVYSWVQALGGAARHARAERNARELFDLERTLHLDVERTLNTWLAPHRTLTVLANYEYALTYVLSAFLLLGWVWWRRPDVYRWARTSFVWLNLLGCLGFALYPLMPPRLLPGAGFVDTVLQHRTVGSWGSPLVEHANTVAAMPSLHVAWALWVSVVLALISGGARTQLVSAVHVAVTVLVVLATANHWVLDVAGGAAAVALAIRLAGRRPGAPPRVPAADAFFLHVETPGAPQHVGGVVLLDTSARPGGAPTREEVEARIRSVLPHLPRFQQRLSAPSRWRRPTWVGAPDLDWEWHVPLDDLTRPDGRPGGMAAFDALIARIAATPMPRDRPLWQFRVVHGVDTDRAAVVFVVHHVVADGIGTVLQSLQILEPELPPLGGERPRPGALQVLAGTVAGIAQLATDGSPSGRFPVSGTGARDFTTLVVPLPEVRAVARGVGARITDVLLTAVAGGLARVTADRAGLPGTVRVSVPLVMRDPGSAAEGNATAAVMVDLPLHGVGDGYGERQRLAEVARRAERLRGGSRALASRFVMSDVAERLPYPLHRWFARTVYGPRTFSAVVSNMPGPDAQLYVTGARIVWAAPLLPLAPGTPLAVGALGWNGDLVVGLAVDPALVPDARALAAAMTEVLAELGGAPVQAPAQSQASTSSSSSRTVGSSSAGPNSSRRRASR
ncbi:phosphatase PAP2 family protein [Modestobacter sp. NPDC049651]|uniref:bifunctional phosphatase PAP2/O-acyltransferase family protein n=1 Tax=unclassified Modestobacter TaxID=2643866 RepID=UPI0033E708B2